MRVFRHLLRLENKPSSCLSFHWKIVVAGRIHSLCNIGDHGQCRCIWWVEFNSNWAWIRIGWIWICNFLFSFDPMITHIILEFSISWKLCITFIKAVKWIIQRKIECCVGAFTFMFNPEECMYFMLSEDRFYWGRDGGNAAFLRWKCVQCPQMTWSSITLPLIPRVIDPPWKSPSFWLEMLDFPPNKCISSLWGNSPLV